MHEGKGRETDVCTEIQKTQRFVVTVYQFWVFLIALCLQLSAWILSHFSSSASLKHISLSVASRCLLHWLNTVISALSYQLTRSHSPSYTVCLNSIKYTLFCLFDILKLLKVTLKSRWDFCPASVHSLRILFTSQSCRVQASLFVQAVSELQVDGSTKNSHAGFLTSGQPL